MKVDLEWGQKNTIKYKVKAKDLKSALNVLNQRQEWGLFEGNYTYKWKSDSNGTITSLMLSPTYTITMPDWVEHKNQPQECKDSWDTMWKALYEHENGHREIFEKGILKLVAELEAMQSPKTSDVTTVTKQAGKSIQDGHDKFDRETDHGRSRGVEIVITNKCAGKD